MARAWHGWPRKFAVEQSANWINALAVSLSQYSVRLSHSNGWDTAKWAVRQSRAVSNGLVAWAWVMWFPLSSPLKQAIMGTGRAQTHRDWREAPQWTCKATQAAGGSSSLHTTPSFSWNVSQREGWLSPVWHFRHGIPFPGRPTGSISTHF